MPDVFLGRQPIQDRMVRPIGYELLYRVFGEPEANVSDPDQATARVILNTFIELDLDEIVGSTHRAFINMTPRFLTDRCYRPLPRDRVVLEIPTGLASHPELAAAIQEAAEAGYLISLDDYVHDEGYRGLLRSATFVKIDVSGLDAAGVEAAAAALEDVPIKKIAHRVATRDLFQSSRSAGFDFFQGFFFCEPALVTQRALPVDRQSLLQLVAEIQDPQVKIERIQEIVERDVTLAYRLLRLVNSAMYAFRHRIESIQHAVTLLGLGRVRALVSLILLASVDDKPAELMRTALVRARFCELVAKQWPAARPEVWFTVGLLSVVDALTDRAMPDVLSNLHLSDEIHDALVARDGDAGAALSAALACESGSIEDAIVARFGRPLTQSSYVQAMGWASQVGRAVEAVGVGAA